MRCSGSRVWKSIEYRKLSTSASDQRWLPGMICVAPFSAVKSSTAQMVARLTAFRGRAAAYVGEAFPVTPWRAGGTPVSAVTQATIVEEGSVERNVGAK